MPAAAAPIPANDPLEESGEMADVRALFRDTLARFKKKGARQGSNEDSRMFKLKAKLTQVASADDVDRRRSYLKAAGVATTERLARPDDLAEPA